MVVVECLYLIILGVAVEAENIHTEELFDAAYGGRKPEFYSDLLAAVISYRKPGCILDIGAGLGLFVELAHTWGIDITGLEGSRYAVEQAKSRVSGLRMLHHDIGEPFPFEDNSYSNVVLNQVVEHISPNRFDNVLAECSRILVDGGIVFINSPSRRNWKEKEEPTHINMMLPSELEHCLERHDFNVVSRPNYGLWLMPESGKWVRMVAGYLLRIFPHDWLSATANVIAIKSRLHT